ncbi:MAG TPA: acetate/propionate family kinase [Candidatus Binatia bacterium]
MSSKSFILTVNGGSSSVKFALFRSGKVLERTLSGKIERIGLADGKLTLDDIASGRSERHDVSARDHAACVDPLVSLLQHKVSFAELLAVGHRVVHGGMRYGEPVRVTPEVLAELSRLSPYDPEHLPAELGLIEAFGQKFPELPQVVCFDTAFHRRMPRVARLLPIPRRYEAEGLRRYGFHGLSYEFLMEELQRVGGSEAANGRVILAHLGNGASLAAVSGGRSIDTTMGFTPAAGLPMSTRSGDLDPGVVAYLARTERMTVEQFHEMVNSRSGLLGISETSPDVRDLLAAEKNDPRAAEAIALFCYQAKKWLGAFAAALGGLDTLVFAGGIGENSPEVRARICRGLEFIGIELDRDRNQSNEPVISKAGGSVVVRVIRTDEEIQIAKAVRNVMAAETAEQKP